jgi:type I restriction enzyme S subunit
MPEELPKGWVKTKLGEVCLPVLTIQPEDSPDAEFTYFDIGGIDNERNRIAETKTVTGRNAPSRARQAVRKDDILFSTVRTYLRKIARVERDYPNPVASTGFTVIRAAEGVSSQFLFFQILSEDFLQPLHALQTGSSYPAVRNRDVFAQPIVLAPEREQKQIAAKLDAALTRMANGEKAARRALERLQRYRAAVLHAAVTGELTREWREAQQKNKKADLETGKALSQRLLAARRARWEEAELERLRAVGKAPKDDKWKSRYPEPTPPRTDDLPNLPKGWIWASLDQIGELNRGKSKHRPRGDTRLYGGPYPFIQTGDIRKSGGTIREHTQTYSEFGLKQSRLWPTGTLCITIAANIAETGILSYPACFPDSVVGFVQDDTLLKVRFVEFFIRSEKSELERYAPATAQKNINIELLKGLSISLPPFAEQSEIVREVERRLSAGDRLAAVLEQQSARADATRQSLLREAFAGRLVPQNPNDEPASVLLERIRAARETEAKKPKGKPMPKSRSKKKVTHRPLLDVLREHRQPMTPEQLFRESGYEAAFNESDAPQDLVDTFYRELRKLTDKPAKVAERKDSGQQAWLRVLP